MKFFLSKKSRLSVIFLFSVFSSFPLFAQLDPSLVAQYHCDEGNGSSLYDAGPFGNNIALYNISWTSGINGFGIIFNGSTSFGTTNNSLTTTLDFDSSDFTVSAWINTTSPSNNGYKENIISKGDPFNTGYSLSIEHGIPAAYVGSTGLTGNNSSLKPINDGQWHYLVATRLNGIVSLFIDAVFATSYSCRQNISVTTPLILGRHGIKTAEYYQGKLDEVSLYKRALSQTEISDNFQTPKQLNFPILISITSPSQNSQPRFAWYAVPSVQSYTLDIDTSKSFQSPLIQIPVSDTSFVPGKPLPFGTIYWFVTCNEPQERNSLIDSFVIAPLSGNLSGNIPNTSNANVCFKVWPKNNFSSLSIMVPQKSGRIRVKLLLVSGQWSMDRDFYATDLAEFDMNNSIASGIYIVQVKADGISYSSKVFLRR